MTGVTKTERPAGDRALARERLREMVSLPLARPALVERLGLRTPRGVLVWGPPGNGLLELIENAARDADARLFLLPGEKLLGLDGCGRAAVLRELFALARRGVPSVACVTGWDLLAPAEEPIERHRGWLHEVEHAAEQMTDDGRIVLVGTADRVDRVAPALIHGDGLFTRRIFVPPPDGADAADYWSALQQDCHHHYTF